jgi:hypothetical protein
MKDMRDFRRAGIVAVLATVLMLGVSARGSAQDVTDFKVCFDGATYPAPYWTGFCSPVAKLPIGYPELSFGFQSQDLLDARISIDTSGTLEIKANLAAVYFDRPGNNAYGPPATLVLRAKVDRYGKLIGGGGGACATGTEDDALNDFCVKGSVTNPNSGNPITYGGDGQILLRGTLGGPVRGFAFKKQAIQHHECPGGFQQDAEGTWYCTLAADVPYDDFEFLLQLTGGNMYDGIFNTYATGNFVLEGFTNTDLYHAADLFTSGLSFTAPYVWGIAAPTTSSATGAALNMCTGQVSGSVTDYFNPSSGIPGAAISVVGSSSSVTLPADSGPYAADRVCPGTYTVSVIPPLGYAIYGSATTTVTVGTASVAGIDFSLYSTPRVGSAFTTFTQAAWGTKPSGTNAGQVVADYFAFLYPTDGVVIGTPNTAGRYSITERSAAAIQNYLPQAGKSVPLTASYVDTSAKLGNLAGDVLALELNVRFSAFSVTKYGLGGLHVASGPLAGLTVDNVLTIANCVLGGGTTCTTVKIENLTSAIKNINSNYLAGTVDNLYLVP